MTPAPLPPARDSVVQPQLHRTLPLPAWQSDGVPALSVRDTYSVPAEEWPVRMPPLW